MSPRLIICFISHGKDAAFRLEFLVNILFTRADIVETSVGLFCARGNQIVVKESGNRQLRDVVIRTEHHELNLFIKIILKR